MESNTTEYQTKLMRLATIDIGFGYKNSSARALAMPLYTTDVAALI